MKDYEEALATVRAAEVTFADALSTYRAGGSMTDYCAAFATIKAAREAYDQACILAQDIEESTEEETLTYAQPSLFA